MRPGTSTESPVHGIPDLNVPIEGTSSGDVSTHIGAEKLKDLAPVLGNAVEQEVAPEAHHDEMAINYQYRRVNEPSNGECRHYLC